MNKIPYGSFVLALFVLSAGLSFGLSACKDKDDAEAIRRLIQKGADLAEEKDIGDLVDLTADGFVAHPGGYDNKSVKGVLLAAFMRYGKFKLRFPKPDVEVADDGKSATATVHFLIVRQGRTMPGLKELYDDPRKWVESVGEKADLHHMKLDLVSDGGDWKVAQAQIL